MTTPNTTPVRRLEWRLVDDVPEAGDLDAWIIVGLLAKGLTMLSGPPKAGKSWLADAFGEAVANAIPVGGVLPAQVRGRVLLLSAENSPPVTRARIRQLRHPLKSDSSDLIVCMNCGLLHLPDDHALLTDAIKAYRPALVILDPIRRFYTGRENDNDEVGAVTGYFRTLCEELDTSILYLHHVNAEGTKSRGATDWDAAPDCLLRATPVENPRNVATLRVTGEARNSAPPVSYTFIVDADEWGAPRGQRLTFDVEEHRYLTTTWKNFGLEFTGPLAVQLSAHARKVHESMLAFGGAHTLSELVLLTGLKETALPALLRKLVIAGYLEATGDGAERQWSARDDFSSRSH